MIIDLSQAKGQNLVTVETQMPEIGQYPTKPPDNRHQSLLFVLLHAVEGNKDRSH